MKHVFAALLLLIAFGISSYASEPVPNPYLSSKYGAMTHNDSSQSDSFPYETPKGVFNVDLKKSPHVLGGPVGLMQMFSADPDYMWIATSGSIHYVDVSNGAWKSVASIKVPNVVDVPASRLEKGLDKKITSVKQAEDIVTKDWKVNWTRLSVNVYMLVDRDNILYAGNGQNILYAYGLIDSRNPSKGIKILRTLNLEKELNTIASHSNNPSIKKYGIHIAGVSLTYDGKLLILSNRSLTIVDRQFKDKPVTIEFEKDEFVSNSVCIDDKNGIYVASDKMMHKIVWTGSRLSRDAKDGAWSAPYEFGDEPSAVKFGTGTGSTPTLMGFGSDEDKLVVITDGANRMNIVAFWCNDIPSDAKQQPGTKSPRIAGQFPITCGLNPLPVFIQSEQSVVVKDYGAFVVNNMRKEGHPDRLVDVLLGGPVYAPPVGCERVEWDPKANQWKSVWTRNDVVSTSMIPAVSRKSNITFVNGYTAKDGWEVTGMDWDTGKTVTRYIFGQSNYGNGAYALIEFMPNKDLIFNSIGGPFRVSVKE